MFIVGLGGGRPLYLVIIPTKEGVMMTNVGNMARRVQMLCHQISYLHSRLFRCHLRNILVGSLPEPPMVIVHLSVISSVNQIDTHANLGTRGMGNDRLLR